MARSAHPAAPDARAPMTAGAPLELPTALAASVAEGDDGRRVPWLRALPDVVHDVADRWQLELGRPFQPGGTSSWVAPVRDADGRELVLKVGWVHVEAEHEADGLRAWDGRGAVRLIAAQVEGSTASLLLERCRPGEELAGRPDDEQDAVICSLLRRLWVEPPTGHRFRPLAEMCRWWADEQEEQPPPPLDPGLRRAGLELFRSLPLDADREVLLVTDLHAQNVLSAEREPWLVVDPKPFVGDPAYDPLQHLLNHPARLHQDAGGFADRLADRCGVDRRRLRAWLFARCVVEARWFPPWIQEVARELAP